jgi:DNA invertase Pin-like site-specific DNA recombinase
MKTATNAKTPKPATKATTQPTGFSYVRFSTPEQAKGDSLRRQTEATEQWCQRNGVKLDTSLTFRDLGKSAYKGDNRSDTAALGAFIRAVEEGRVPKGAYLIIENLDRLSRQDERTALRLWLDLLDRGIHIVQLSPECVFRAERSDMVDVMRAIIELSRGHSESRIKSERVGAAWSQKKKKAREGTHIITNMLPAWVTRDGDTLKLDRRAAEVVRRIFRMAAEGYGHAAIVKRLTADKVKPIGVGDHWSRSFIASILRDRRAVGEFQPRRRDGSKDGPPIPGYFPAAVTEAEYAAARAAAGARRQTPGSINRISEHGELNVFAGLVRSWDDSTSFYVATRTEGDRHYRVLVPTAAAEGRAKCVSFPYPTFEVGLLSQLAELDPADVIPADAGPSELKAARSELDWVRGRITEMKAELLKGNVSAVADVLRQLESQESELAQRVEEAEVDTTVPVAQTWGDARQLMATITTIGGDGRDGLRAVLGAVEAEPTDARVRLRAALRRLITRIRVVFMPSGRNRLALAQVEFTSGTARQYAIVHQPPRANASGRTPGRWLSYSIASEPTDNPNDLAARVLNGAADMLTRIVATGNADGTKLGYASGIIE